MLTNRSDGAVMELPLTFIHISFFHSDSVHAPVQVRLLVFTSDPSFYVINQGCSKYGFRFVCRPKSLSCTAYLNLLFHQLLNYLFIFLSRNFNSINSNYQWWARYYFENSIFIFILKIENTILFSIFKILFKTILFYYFQKSFKKHFLRKKIVFQNRFSK